MCVFVHSNALYVGFISYWYFSRNLASKCCTHAISILPIEWFHIFYEKARCILSFSNCNVFFFATKQNKNHQ